MSLETNPQAATSTVRQERKSPRRSGSKLSGSQLGSRALLYLALTSWAVVTLIPLLWSIAASFTPADEIFKNLTPFTWNALFPPNPTLKAYEELLSSPTFVRSLGNTLFVCAATVIGGLLANSLAGFAFAAFEFPLKRFLMTLVMVSFMVPFEVIVIPLYGIVTTLGLTNSFQALILPTLANGAIIFMFRQFFLETPRDLLEAARIDGLSWFGIYTRIVIPLSMPVMVSAGLSLFLIQWQSFFWPLLVANRPEYQVVQLALANMNTLYVYRWDLQLAGSVFTIAFPVILLSFLQRYYIATVAGTGSKE